MTNEEAVALNYYANYALYVTKIAEKINKPIEWVDALKIGFQLAKVDKYSFGEITHGGYDREIENLIISITEGKKQIPVKTNTIKNEDLEICIKRGLAAFLAFVTFVGVAFKLKNMQIRDEAKANTEKIMKLINGDNEEGIYNANTNEFDKDLMVAQDIAKIYEQFPELLDVLLYNTFSNYSKDYPEVGERLAHMDNVLNHLKRLLPKNWDLAICKTFLDYMFNSIRSRERGDKYREELGENVFEYLDVIKIYNDVGNVVTEDVGTGLGLSKGQMRDLIEILNLYAKAGYKLYENFSEDIQRAIETFKEEKGMPR